MEIVLAVLLGAAFGAVLDLIGASNPSVLGRMLKLANLRLMKAIILGIGIASILMFAGQMLGVVDVGHMSVKAAYVGVFVGGLLMGIGWAVSGFCPGTGVVALGVGRRDAIAFVVGGLLGAGAYMLSFADIQATGLLDPIAGGAVTLGTVPSSKFEGLFAVRGDVLGIVLGLVFVIVAFILPEHPSRAPTSTPAE